MLEILAKKPFGELKLNDGMWKVYDNKANTFPTGNLNQVGILYEVLRILL